MSEDLRLSRVPADAVRVIGPLIPGEGRKVLTETLDYFGASADNGAWLRHLRAAGFDDPEAWAAWLEGQSARLCHMGHALVENRSGMVVGASVTEASGTAEREAGLKLLGELPKRAGRRTVGCDKGYDGKAFVEGCRDLNVTPHAAAKRSGGAVDGRTTRHEGCSESMVRRKRVEEPFG